LFSYSYISYVAIYGSYVGNLPPGVTVPQLAEFLNTVMKQVGLAKGNMGSVVTAWESSDGHYAFVEFRTIDETLGALTYLNGLQVGAHSLKVGRPKGYNGSSSSVAVPMGAVTSSIGLSFLGKHKFFLSKLQSNHNIFTVGGLNGAATSTGVNPLLAAASNPLGIGLLPSLGGPDVSQSNFLMVTNVPIGIEENQASELFSTFGEVRISLNSRYSRHNQTFIILI
jgi:splicing factor U2AF subunit